MNVARDVVRSRGVAHRVSIVGTYNILLNDVVRIAVEWLLPTYLQYLRLQRRVSVILVCRKMVKICPTIR